MSEDVFEYDENGERHQVKCGICYAPITYAELCGECARDNDPFFTTKHSDLKPINPWEPL